MTQTTTDYTIRLGITRATFYQRKNGGGYRVARKPFTCMQFGCLKTVHPGEKYFDTRELVFWPKMKRICECCAETQV